MLYATKSLRLFALGLASIALPLQLAATHARPVVIGAIIALALISGALQAAATGAVAKLLPLKAIAVVSAVVMAAGGVLASIGGEAFMLVAAALGALNASGTEAGPMLPLEHMTLARGPNATQRMALYNAIGAAALAAGTLGAAYLRLSTVFLLYAACAVAVAAMYLFTRFPHRESLRSAARRSPRGEKLAALFAVDAFAGGLIVQGFIAYWLGSRYHVAPHAIATLLAGCNILAGTSLFVAIPLARKFGLLNTMVFTHLPSNILLVFVPFAPTFPIAAVLLLVRYSLSQMDVPTRQAFTIAMVPQDEQAYAAGLSAAVRPAAASVSPMLAGMAMQMAASGLPFFLSGIVKAAYDLTIFAAFRKEA